MPISPAREALNTPVKRPSVLVDDMPGKARVGLCVPTARGVIPFRRVPNYTGAAGHRFHADFTFRPDDVAHDWRGHVTVYQLTPDGAEFPRFETAVYRNGRMLPDNQLATLRDAALQAYAAAFPWCNAGEFKAWAEREHGTTPIVDSYGTWGRAANLKGEGFTYRGEVGTLETLACLVEDIRNGVAYVNPDPATVTPRAPVPCFVCGNTAPHGICDPADIAAHNAGTVSSAYAARQLAAGRTPETSEGEYGFTQQTENGPVWHALPDYVPPAAPAPAKRHVETIDVTPTWAGLIPAFLALIENGNATGRAHAIAELGRLARIADAAVAEVKAREGLANGPAGAPRARFEADITAAPAPGDFPDVAALLGPRERGNPSDVFNMTETEARAVVWAWGRIVPGLVATPATEELGGEHEAHMGYGLTIAGNPGQWLWISRAALAHAVAMAKAVPALAARGTLPDCMRTGHSPDASGRYCRDCGAAIG